MRRPIAVVSVIVIVLLALGAPFLRISWGAADASSLPASSTARQVQEALENDFPANSTNPIEAVVTGVTNPAQLTAYTDKIDAIPGVTGAQVTARHGTSVRLDVGYTPQPSSPQARQIVTSIRALAPPAHTSVLVGGTTAMLVDELSSLGGTLPWMALLTAVATLVLLFLAFGSVVLPIKAIVMNILSLSATFGVIVWVFQWGHLSGPLDFTATGTIDPTTPILLLAGSLARSSLSCAPGNAPSHHASAPPGTKNGMSVMPTRIPREMKSACRASLLLLLDFAL
jgi:RND superfamily putative drug exporter